MMSQQSESIWIPMSEAAKEIGVSVSKLSRLARLNRIETQKDVYDERVTLVNIEELRRLYPKKR